MTRGVSIIHWGPPKLITKKGESDVWGAILLTLQEIHSLYYRICQSQVATPIDVVPFKQGVMSPCHLFPLR